jgi:hypothetical protein
MTHEAFFSTADPSLTSFLRFPYDIRLQIYGYLLCGPISYSLCLRTRRIVMLADSCQRRIGYCYARHGLFPAILECCRLIHDEATPILYGSNLFSADCQVVHRGWTYAMNSWPMSERNLQLITKLEMCWPGHDDEGGEPSPATLLQLSRLFPALRTASITMTLTPTEFETFLSSYADVLAAVPALDFRIGVPHEYAFAVWQKHAEVGEDGPRRVDDLSKRCLELYRPTTEKLSGRFNRRVTWRGQDRSLSYGWAYVGVGMWWEDFATNLCSKKLQMAGLAARTGSSFLLQ